MNVTPGQEEDTGMETYTSDLKPGAILIARDGREFTFLEYDEEGNMMLKYGPGRDEVSWWGKDGRAEPDDTDFVSDADIVAVKENLLF